MPAPARAEKHAERSRVAAQAVVAPEIGFRLKLDLEADARTHLVAARIVAARCDAGVALDLAHRAVAAEDSDATRMPDGVVRDLAHRHLGHRDARHRGRR